jgi:hypothetical protein
MRDAASAASVGKTTNTHFCVETLTKCIVKRNAGRSENNSNPSMLASVHCTDL